MVDTVATDSINREVRGRLMLPTGRTPWGREGALSARGALPSLTLAGTVKGGFLAFRVWLFRGGMVLYGLYKTAST
jgi:hypothetical protein